MKLKFLLSFFSLLVLVIVLLNKKQVHKPDKDYFSLKDEAKLDRILIYKKGLPSGGFLKDFDGNWQLSNGTSVDKKMSSLLIKVLKSVEVRQTANQDNAEIRELLKNKGLIIEYYQAKYLLKSFYLATDVKKNLNYIMSEEDEVPYIIDVPQVAGKINLSALFSLPEYNWKDKTLFANDFRDIEEVEVEYYHSEKDSFKIETREEKLLVNGLASRNSKGVKQYLTNFSFVEGVQITQNEVLRDSLKLSNPYCRITLQDKDLNKNRSLVLYDDPLNKDILLGQLNNNPDIYIIPVQNIKYLLISGSNLL